MRVNKIEAKIILDALEYSHTSMLDGRPLGSPPGYTAVEKPVLEKMMKELYEKLMK